MAKVTLNPLPGSQSSVSVTATMRVPLPQPALTRQFQIPMHTPSFHPRFAPLRARTHCSLWLVLGCFALATLSQPAAATGGTTNVVVGGTTNVVVGGTTNVVVPGKGHKSKKFITIVRKSFGRSGTTGVGQERTTGTIAVNQKSVGYTLEPPWVGNETYFSSLPTGTYAGVVSEVTEELLKLDLTGAKGVAGEIQIANSATQVPDGIAVGKMWDSSTGGVTGSEVAFKAIAKDLAEGDSVSVSLAGAAPRVPVKTALSVSISPTRAAPGDMVTITAKLCVAPPGPSILVTGKPLLAFTNLGSRRPVTQADLTPLPDGVEQDDGSVKFEYEMPQLRNVKASEAHLFSVVFVGDDNYQAVKRTQLRVSLAPEKAGKK